MTKLDEELLVGFGEVVDRLVSTPSGTVPLLRKGRDGVAKSRYSWMKVYDETRARYGRPLTLLAAEKIIENVKPGDYVLIITNSHEMDGPPGAASMARSLLVGLRAIPIIMATANCLDFIFADSEILKPSSWLGIMDITPLISSVMK